MAQDCLKRSLPEHHQFKGFPTCFGTSDIDEIWKELKAGDVPADIIATSGEYVSSCSCLLFSAWLVRLAAHLLHHMGTSQQQHGQTHVASNMPMARFVVAFEGELRPADQSPYLSRGYLCHVAHARCQIPS